MILLDDPIWETLVGGYKLPYNAAPLLCELESGLGDTEGIWEEFWNELHHQGDVGTASYAAVLHLVRICIKRDIMDWNAFALVAVIAIINYQLGCLPNSQRRIFPKNGRKR
jgi:hypothetical protein